MRTCAECNAAAAVMRPPTGAVRVRTRCQTDPMPTRPEIVCICGSMRYVEDMRIVGESLTLAGLIVLMPTVIDRPITDEQKAALGELHLRRIDLADRVVVVNRGPHYGESTLHEIAYAEAAGKPVTFVGPAWGLQ